MTGLVRVFRRGDPVAADLVWDALSIDAQIPETVPAASSRLKRFVDLVLASAGLILLLPLLAAICVAIVIDSGWPPLFPQYRVGIRGRRFRLWKFRTMVRDAEKMRPALESLNEAPFPAFKLRRDPRVTRVGRFLRRASLDELPQLWNVIKGDMSLVGPRPPLPHEVAAYDATAMRRLWVRPGITCIWQIENRHRTHSTFEDWVAQDLAYIAGWTLWLDVVLIVKTLRAVTRMTGE